MLAQMRPTSVLGALWNMDTYSEVKMAFSLKSGAMVGMLALGLAACGSAGIDPGAESTSSDSEEFGLRRIKYLALGDSIAFGMNPLVSPPGNPANYKGYPEVI